MQALYTVEDTHQGLINDKFLENYLAPTGSYDGFVLQNHANSKKGHRDTTLANIEGSPLAVGGAHPSINKAETYDISTDTWTEVDEYPYHNS